MQDRNSPRVARLADLDNYEVADHDPDIRGWDVISADGRKVGKVDDLFVDTAAMKVRYIGVDVDKSLSAGDSRSRILVPVGHARLHESDDHVHISGLKADRVSAVPPYTGTIDREYETSLSTWFTDTGAAPATGAASKAGATDDFYDRDDYNADRMYGSRRHEQEKR
ncbi:MAG TPA: PRC-barrel domain-containing protein [Longimicrobiales bacterium]|nr:PRC-barrel domain-containing protein [Longimicrobiales bacterium]